MDAISSTSDTTTQSLAQFSSETTLNATTTTSQSSTLDASSLDSMDSMLASLDSSLQSEQMMQLAIALIILQMINSGETDTSAITDLLGSLTSDNLLESASDLLGEGTFAYESQTEITINQTTNASYIENAYADDSTNDTTEQFNNVDVLI